MMICSYAAVFSPMEEGGGYYVRFPDLPGCITTGKDLNDALAMAADVLPLWLITAEDAGETVAAPSDLRSILHEENDIVTLVQADTVRYRAMNDNRAVRKNVSLPQWMVTLADSMGLNCSQILQEALRERFGKQARV